MLGGATGATGAQQFAEARDNFAAFVDHWKGQMGHACHVLNPPAMLALARWRAGALALADWGFASKPLLRRSNPC